VHPTVASSTLGHFRTVDNEYLVAKVTMPMLMMLLILMTVMTSLE